MKINVRNRNKGTDKPASWEYRFEVAKIGGKRKQFSKSGFRTKKEAEAAGLKALNDYNNSGTVAVNYNMSFSDFIDLWLVQYAEPNLKESSYNFTKETIENHIRPDLGAYMIKSLNPISLQTFVNELYKKPLSHEYKNSIRTLLSQILKYAVVPCGLIQNNPAQYLKTPQDLVNGKSVERMIYTPDQVMKLIDYYGTYHPYSAAIMISYNSGLRAGEVFSLTWNDIDFEKKTISVTKTVTLTQKITPPKTKSSIRTVSVGDTLIKYLKKYRQEQIKNEIYYGEYYTHLALQNGVICVSDKKDDNFIMRRENGEYAPYRAFKDNATKTVAKKVGFPVNFHSFRHTHATKLIEAGVSPKVVQERLGHADISTTLNLYVHVTGKMQDEAVDAFEKRWARGTHFDFFVNLKALKTLQIKDSSPKLRI